MKFSDISDFMGFTDSRKNKPIEPESKKFDRDDIGPKKILLTWEATPRVVSREIPEKLKKTAIIVGVVVGLLFLAMQENFLILVVISLFVLSYALSKNPIGEQKYELSTHGLSIAGRMYYWDEMEKFFFTADSNTSILSIDLKEGLARRLFIAFHAKDKPKLVDILNGHIQYLEEAPLTVLDKTYNKILDKFDLEDEKSKK